MKLTGALGRVFFSLGCLALVRPDPAFAAQATTPPSYSCLDVVLTWAPVIAILILLVWYFKWSGITRYRTQMERSREHMDRVEKQNEEILETLKRIEAALERR